MPELLEFVLAQDLLSSSGIGTPGHKQTQASMFAICSPMSTCEIIGSYAGAIGCHDTSRSWRNGSTVLLTMTRNGHGATTSLQRKPVPVVRQEPKQPVPRLSLLRWGLIPSWSKDTTGAADQRQVRDSGDAARIPRCAQVSQMPSSRRWLLRVAEDWQGQAAVLL